jgi:hypothetical protein
MQAKCPNQRARRGLEQGDCRASLAQVTPDVGCDDADLGDGCFQLLLGHAESFRPISELVSFMDVDAGAIGGAAVLKIVCHADDVSPRLLLGNCGEEVRHGGLAVATLLGSTPSVSPEVAARLPIAGLPSGVAKARVASCFAAFAP